MIQLINVNKNFDHKLILEDLSFSVENGAVIGLVGPNGAGKSTIIRMIAGVIQADAGVVVVNEYNVFDNAEIKKDIFLLADDPYFFVQSSLKDMKEYYKLFYPNFDDVYYDQLIAEFNISETDKLSTFSKGMKRQASLILAMAARPRILLMDETFDGLDPLMRFKLKQFIVDHIENEDRIIIISSHSLLELEGICDRIILVNKNNITINDSLDKIYDLYHKFTVMFEEKPNSKIFTSLRSISIEGDDRIYTIIQKGKKDEETKKIQELKPFILEYSKMDLDEVYRYEVKGEKYEKHN